MNFKLYLQKLVELMMKYSIVLLDSFCIKEFKLFSLFIFIYYTILICVKNICKI